MTDGRMANALESTADPEWTLWENGCDPLRESSLGSRFAISNGFLGVRGGPSVSHGGRWVVPPRTYVAGLFDTPAAVGSIPGLVPAADWLRIEIATDDGPMTHAPEEGPGHRVTLDMRRGLHLSLCQEWSGPGLDVRLRTLRLVSLSERALGLELVQVEVLRGEVETTLEASFQGVDLGLLPLELAQDRGVWRTRQSHRTLVMAADARMLLDDRDLPPIARGPLTWRWTWTSRPGQVACLARIVAVTRSETEGSESAADAVARLGAAQHRGWRTLVADHERAWAARWRCSDIEVEGDPDAQKALRFAAYHLNSAANPNDDSVSIGARALTGDDYLGHVFWDTEIFMLPFYIFTWPEAARALLGYRHRTLDAARAKAAAMGWRGALYAWESADTGAEATPQHAIGPDRKVLAILTGGREQHISADVAYAVWQYWQASGDADFLRDQGGEILLETGRFWASRAKLEADGRRHIRGVIGPDEYHEDVDDNAFTNVMARWNILRALDVAQILAERWPDHWARLSKRLDLTEAELRAWASVADAIATGLDPKTGLFEQFEGYFALEEIDLATFAGRSVPMDVVLGRERIMRSQVIKQADVVALLALLPEAFSGLSGAENYRFYAPRCGHGSSLSRALHGVVAARLGATDQALEHFQKTAAIDLADAHVAIAGGIHIGAQGGLWQIAVFGFAGLSIRGDALAIDPQLPEGWASLSFRIQWLGRYLKLKISRDDSLLEVTLEAGQPMALWINAKSHALTADETLTVVFASRPWRVLDGDVAAASRDETGADARRSQDAARS